MNYPDIAQVEAADRVQLARWMRFLPSPAFGFVGTPEFEKELARHVEILDRISARFEQFGGWNPMLSKVVGW